MYSTQLCTFSCLLFPFEACLKSLPLPLPLSPQRPARVRHRQGGEGDEEAAERPHETEGQAGTPGLALPRGQNGAPQIQGRLDFVMSFFQVYLSYPK